MEKEAPPYVPASIAFSPDGSILAIGYLEGHLQLWDLREEKLFSKLEEYQGEVVDLAFSPDGKTLVSVSKNEDGMDLGIAELWSASDGKRLYQLGATGVMIAAFSKDGEILATGSYDHKVRF